MPRSALTAVLLAALALVVAGCADGVELSAVGTRPAAGAAPTPSPTSTLSPPPGRPPVTDTDADPETAPYGSGRLGAWEQNGRELSTPEQFGEVARTDGVLIVGDSIAGAAARECAARFGSGHGLATAVNTWNGRPTTPSADWIVANAEFIPDRGIVVVAGANDIFDPVGWWRQVERVVAAAAGKPVYWLTVHVDRWGMPAEVRAADRENSRWVNDQLRWLADRHPGLVLVDWHAVVAGAGATLLDDGVHPTPDGVGAWCGLLESALGL